MQELRVAVYFCKDFWEKYCEAAANMMYTDAQEVPKKAMSVCLQLRNSSKPKHLVAFLIRAKALYKQTSVVDEPINHKIVKELEYATWLATQIGQLVQLADLKVVMQRDAQVVHTEKLLAKSKGIVYCSNCHRETKKHYDYCKICGKRQLFLLDRLPDDEVDDGSKLTKSQIHALKFGGDNGLHVEGDGEGMLLENAEGEEDAEGDRGENIVSSADQEEEGVANPSGEHSARDVNHLNELPDNPADENDDTSKLSDDDDVSDEDDDEDYKED